MDRSRVRAYAVASAIVLVCVLAVRWWAPSAYAPRVHVRWADGTSDASRATLETQFGLAFGERREGTTWAYDLTNVSPEFVKTLLMHPAVADTSEIDRSTGMISRAAPSGATRLEQSGARWLLYSPLFTWFVLFWISSLLVSGAWLRTTSPTS